MNIKSEAELLIIYPWIKSEFFEKILQTQNNNESVTIKNFHIKAALPKGENYASQMIRATINYKCNNKEHTTNESAKEFTTMLIIKTDLKENDKLVGEFNFLIKEIIAHEQILPKVHELLSSINHTNRLSPKCYDCCVNPFFMVFEDLTQRGYKNVDKEFGLDFEHFKILLLKVAKWHATTAVLMEKDKSLFENNMELPINDKTDFLLKMYKNALLSCVEVVKHWDGYEDLAEKLLKLLTTVEKKCTKAFSINNNEFNVLNHGDLWSNNVMFKDGYNGKVEDAILVDYSFGYWGSPALDLSYLFYTSSSVNVQEKEWDQLLAFYHKHLILVLDELKYTGAFPTLTDIHIAILKRGVCAAFTSLIGVGVRKLKDVENVNVDTFFGDSIETQMMRFKILSNPNCKPELKYLLDYFNRKGYFE